MSILIHTLESIAELFFYFSLPSTQSNTHKGSIYHTANQREEYELGQLENHTRTSGYRMPSQVRISLGGVNDCDIASINQSEL